MAESAFAYHEPSIAIILNQTGLLLALNLINTCLDKLLYCGLIGQLFIGILWGTPGAKWLDRDTETIIQQLGYLGLIMLVYEGGLSTSLSSLRANMYLSIAVALTGIAIPIALSFVLMELVSATPLQAFAAGAALSATSLGTTFTILSTTGLITTRLGTVTTSAAMLDDVVGLSFSAVTVIRPLFVSLGFGVAVVLVCRFVARPILLRILEKGVGKGEFPEFVRTSQFAFLGYTALLVGLVAGATYAGTSSLFAAYLAGVITSWFDGLVCAVPAGPSQGQEQVQSDQTPAHQTITGTYIYEHYYHGPVKRILIPMFFASIGFAIPITEMFQGNVVWRGVVYAILMALGKLSTGVWLVRFFSPRSTSLVSFVRILKIPLVYATSCIPRHRSSKPLIIEKGRNNRGPQTDQTQDNPAPTTEEPNPPTNPTLNQEQEQQPHQETPHNPPHFQHSQHSHPQDILTPKSLYPASILALAMTARGEIGYLIASLAESNSVFGDTSNGSTETYLVVVWAISLCTLVGPVSVGTLVRRVKALQRRRRDSREGSGSGAGGVLDIRGSSLNHRVKTGI
ncbi:Sodium/hydrogen exchanger family-domain-containing protein [Aspergillus cavernicola]|uniref:Sodium/hydrogen exchanger family-domain-containing protein n=1 Tax=Aspergillus cavernicola TaxID=176166 RepID=A0ABR4IJJ9_9EURO